MGDDGDVVVENGCCMVEGGEFERLVTTCYAALVRTAVLLTGDRGHAEDLVQAAPVRTYLAWGRLRSTDSAEAYTRTVMARLAIKWGRRRWRGERPTAVVGDAAAPDEFDDADRADVIVRALRRLPPEQRAVLVLRYWEQRSEAEIAEPVALLDGTVKSRAARAIAALRASGLLTDVQSAMTGDADAR